MYASYRGALLSPADAVMVARPGRPSIGRPARTTSSPGVDAGSGYAAGAGARRPSIAMFDRVTGLLPRQRRRGAHRGSSSASVMKLFIADNLLHRRPSSARSA